MHATSEVGLYICVDDLIMDHSPIGTQDTPAKGKTTKEDKKTIERPHSPRNEGAEISGPMNVQHKVHVNKDFQWSGDDIFDLSEKLGEGYMHSHAISVSCSRLLLLTQYSISHLVPTAPCTKQPSQAQMQCWR